jgi:hypothetical protein
MKEQRPQSFLFIVTGVFLGLILGVMSAWFLFPVDQSNNHPQSLRADYKLRYRVLTAIAYVANGDLGRAEARLNLLGEQITFHSLAAEAQIFLGEGEDENTARAMALLAAGLENPNKTMGDVGIGEVPYGTPSTKPAVVVDIGSPTPTQTISVIENSTVSPTATKMPTFTPRPSSTPLPIQEGGYVLSKYPLVCENQFDSPMIGVYVKDEQQQGMAGVELFATWEGGKDQFITGLKPEFGYGYADFEMQAGQLVQISLEEGKEKTPPLDLPYCLDSNGESYFGIWQVYYIQP